MYIWFSRLLHFHTGTWVLNTYYYYILIVHLYTINLDYSVLVLHYRRIIYIYIYIYIRSFYDSTLVQLQRYILYLSRAATSWYCTL